MTNTINKVRIGKRIPNVFELVTKIDVPMLRVSIPILKVLNHVSWFLSKAPWITLAKPLNITLIATDSKVSDLSDISAGDTKAIMANTIATVPRPMFVKGATFLLLLDDSLLSAKMKIIQHLQFLKLFFQLQWLTMQLKGV
jgi:hypothetical protein